MNEEVKNFSEDFINKHLAALPDAATFEDDIIEHLVFEGYDPNAAERPTNLTALYLVFEKNADKSGWVLAGYRY